MTRRRAVLASQVEVKTFAASQRIYKMGDPSGQAFILVSGSVRVTMVDEDHQEVVVDQPAARRVFRLRVDAGSDAPSN